MRMFFLELKKLWNWKTTAAILAILVLYFSLFLWHDITRIKQLKTGDEMSPMMDFALYEELLDRYGTVITSDEILDFGIDEKIQALIDRVDAIIATDESGVFAKYGIGNYEELYSTDWRMIGSEELDAMIIGGETAIRNLSIQLSLLGDIKQRYGTNSSRSRRADDTAFVYARELKAREERSIMPYYIPYELSGYFAMLTILCVICALILALPLVTTDHARKVHLLLYSSSYGRKILRTQFAAVIISAFAMSLIFTGFSCAAYAALNTQIFRDASIVSFWGQAFFMYGVSYGQYAMLLAVMPVVFSVAVACMGFVLSRFSDSYVKLSIKAVPAGVAGVILGYSSVSVALSSENFIFNLLGRKLPVPEIWLCAIALAVGVIVAAIVVAREKCVDVMS